MRAGAAGVFYTGRGGLPRDGAWGLHILRKSEYTGHMLRFFIVVLVGVVGVGGCAARTGPSVSRAEVRAMERQLERRRWAFELDQHVRLHTVSRRLLRAMPGATSGKPAQSCGVVLLQINKKVARALELSRTHGVVVAGLVPGGPAEGLDVQRGDVLLKLNGTGVRSVKRLRRMLDEAPLGAPVTLTLLRGAVPYVVTVTPEPVELGLYFYLVSKPQVNAETRSGPSVHLYHGALRFIRSDDELAVLLGHELAHVAERHLKEQFGVKMVATTLNQAASAVLNTALPGSSLLTSLLFAAVEAAASRDREREADYLGALYVYQAGYDLERGLAFWERVATEAEAGFALPFLESHPLTAERLARLQKVAHTVRRAQQTGPEAPEQDVVLPGPGPR